MRAVLAIALAFAAGFIMAAMASKNHNYPRFFKHRTKLREIRGFKPEYISTAIGFGKRETPMEFQDFSGREKILLKNLLRDVPTEVLFRTLQTNPALTSKLMQLLTQNDLGDEEPMKGADDEEHSKPESTLAVF